MMYSQNEENKQKGIHFLYKFGVFAEDQQRTGDETLHCCRFVRFAQGNLLNAVVYLRSIVFRIAQTSQILFHFIFLAVLER